MANIYENSQGKAFATQNEAAASNTVLGTNPITVKDLSATKTPTIAPSVPDTSGAALSGAVEATTDQFTKGLEQEAQRTVQGRNTSLESLLATDAPDKDVLSLQEGQKAGLDPLQGEITDINNQILSEQQSLRRRLEAIDKNPRGMFGGAIEQEKRRVENESLAKQADLSVIALAKQGKYDSAKAIADRAVALKFAQQTQDYNRALLAYRENKEMFTLAEQRLFESRAKDRQNKLDMEMYKEKQAYDQKIKESDPNYQLDLSLKGLQIKEAKAKLDALTAPESGVPKATQEKISKLTDKGREALVGVTDTVSQLERIKQLIAENDAVTLSNPATERGRLFSRLATDVADKMARERTGAVVTAEEQANFKKILGLSLFNRALASPEEINRELDFFIKKHNSSASLYDPTGEIRTFIASQTQDEDSYLDSVSGSIDDPYSLYLSNVLQVGSSALTGGTK